MVKFFDFLREKMYLGILIVLGCAMLGSVLGARKESKETLPGIVPADLQLMEQANENAPELTGILPMAASQNKWYNFKYAIAFGLAGAVIYCFLMAIYMCLYDIRFFKTLRHFLKTGFYEEKLFLNLDRKD